MTGGYRRFCPQCGSRIPHHLYGCPEYVDDDEGPDDTWVERQDRALEESKERRDES